MRKIEQKMCDALKGHRDFKSGNTEVRQNRSIGTAHVYLHGHMIGAVAYDLLPGSGYTGEVIEVNVDDCGWQTVTTKSRINALLAAFGRGATVYQSDWQWYIVDANGTNDWHGWAAVDSSTGEMTAGGRVNGQRLPA